MQNLQKESNNSLLEKVNFAVFGMGDSA